MIDIFNSRNSKNITVVFFAFIFAICLFSGSSRSLLALKLAFCFISGFITLGILLFVPRVWARPEIKAVSIAFAAFCILGFVQLIPLLSEDSSLVRRNISEVFDVFGVSYSRLQSSVSPAATVLVLVKLLLPFGVFISLIALEKHIKFMLLAWLIPALAGLSALLGIGQMAMGGKGALYFYSVTNIGTPVGIFANVNHQATLLAMAIPFLGLIISRSDHTQKQLAILTGLLVAFGILIAGSLAGYGLFLLAFLMSGLLYARTKNRRRKSLITPKVLLGVGAAILAGVILFIQSGYFEGFLALINSDSEQYGRLGIWLVSLEVFKDHSILGSGLGSFSDIYRLYEADDGLNSSYVNHAHNDYVEWIVETGLVGALLLGGSLLWMLRAALKVWRGDKKSRMRPLRQAGAIALLVVVVHSFVDYPIRTGTISVLCAICLALLFAERPSSSNKKARNTVDL